MLAFNPTFFFPRAIVAEDSKSKLLLMNNEWKNLKCIKNFFLFLYKKRRKKKEEGKAFSFSLLTVHVRNRNKGINYTNAEKNFSSDNYNRLLSNIPQVRISHSTTTLPESSCSSQTITGPDPRNFKILFWVAESE